MEARGRTKRAREDADGANDAGLSDGRRDDAADDGDDDGDGGATRASNDDGDEAAEGERARGDAAARRVDGTRGRNAASPGSEKTRDMRAHFRKARPLGEEDVATLDEAGRRRALARWSARLRVLKKKIRDAGAQYPTSSLVFVFTKPIRSNARSDRWCVQIARRARRRARH